MDNVLPIGIKQNIDQRLSQLKPKTDEEKEYIEKLKSISNLKLLDSALELLETYYQIDKRNIVKQKVYWLSFQHIVDSSLLIEFERKLLLCLKTIKEFQQEAVDNKNHILTTQQKEILSTEVNIYQTCINEIQRVFY